MFLVWPRQFVTVRARQCAGTVDNLAKDTAVQHDPARQVTAGQSPKNGQLGIDIHACLKRVGDFRNVMQFSGDLVSFRHMRMRKMPHKSIAKLGFHWQRPERALADRATVHTHKNPASLYHIVKVYKQAGRSKGKRYVFNTFCSGSNLHDSLRALVARIAELANGGLPQGALQ